MTVTTPGGTSATSTADDFTYTGILPVTTNDAPTAWQNQDVAVHLTATTADGSGVAAIHYQVDSNGWVVVPGSGNTFTTAVTVPAPADGSNDGAHRSSTTRSAAPACRTRSIAAP